MSAVFQILSFLAVAAVSVVLLMGLWNMAKGGSPNRSQSLMRMRVMLQALALLVLMTLLWVSSKG
jgi:hypothetical protein